MTDNTELLEQIAYFRERVSWQATRGRAGGTYDHQRLRELEAALEENPQGIDDSMEDHNAKQDI